LSCAITPGRVVAVVAEMISDLRFQAGLQHPLGQIAEQAARADQLDPVGTA